MSIVRLLSQITSLTVLLSDKSGKKFAPKAPVRRAPAGAPARRPSAAQQAQAQAAQASQAVAQEKEKSVASSLTTPVPTSASPVAAEQQATVEAPVAAPQPPETVQAVPKSVTSIAIPRPKAKASVSLPIPAPTPAPTHTPTHTPTPAPSVTTTTPPSTLDESTSPRTPAIEPTIVQSIENDVEHAVASQIALEVRPDTGTAEAPPQKSPRINLKGAKKSSEINRPRAQPRPRGPIATPPTTQRTSETPVHSAAPSVALSTPEPSQASSRKRKASKAGNSDDGTENPKRAPRKRKREVTPEGADTVEILPNVIKMSELCKDLKTGKKSQREIALRRLEIEEQERKHKEKGKEKNGTPGASGTPKANDTNKETADPPVEPEKATGPVMRIVNGEIVLDAASLQVDRHADAARNAGDMDVVEENQLTRKINQATYGKRSKTETWDEEMTDLFYRGLRMFGTDFMVISKLFPGRSRRQIKLKFNNEERKNPERIKTTLLGPSESIDIQTYSEMTNETYDDPVVIQRELDEEKAKIEEQQDKEKKLKEDMIRNPTNAADADADDKTNSAPTKSKGRNNKKQVKNAGGGTEEVLGTID